MSPSLSPYPFSLLRTLMSTLRLPSLTRWGRWRPMPNAGRRAPSALPLWARVLEGASAARLFRAYTQGCGRPTPTLPLPSPRCTLPQACSSKRGALGSARAARLLLPPFRRYLKFPVVKHTCACTPQLIVLMMREPDILLAEQHPPLSITACLNLLQNSRNTTSSPAARFLNMSQILAKLILRGKITKLKFKLLRPSLVQPARSLQSGGNQIGRKKGGGKGGRGAHTPGGKGIWFPQCTEDDCPEAPCLLSLSLILRGGWCCLHLPRLTWTVFCMCALYMTANNGRDG